ncbi:hypothetical protein MPTK1_5g10410 [Marchantia polymorpha subsp. ruderalis]|uniref:Uncharacterized protein n=2 Tax=Marchantia polymorpha TaxID=3197 RepID=A0AAF6BGX8_MARPO|nr:hypothetical protein MARPO_0048s0031 [Marchantia polymorpha]BBN11262.1 hypothetical protein Mp_5g10410 [Marchantia polymorpha subsp. ruderalis]|eukprot:PTQ38908.1 hypothetical protein MARPO_0048s0031 [Marchantia polymorpha]
MCKRVEQFVAAIDFRITAARAGGPMRISEDIPPGCRPQIRIPKHIHFRFPEHFRYTGPSNISCQICAPERLARSFRRWPDLTHSNAT